MLNAPEANGYSLVLLMLVQMLVLPALPVVVDVEDEKSVPDPHDICHDAEALVLFVALEYDNRC